MPELYSNGLFTTSFPNHFSVGYARTLYRFASSRSVVASTLTNCTLSLRVQPGVTLCQRQLLYTRTTYARSKLLARVSNSG